ncbi:hypothetical protein [Mucilaginibacter sp.]|uniref:hypothetical protein n=1 Tax=Mucilaginibacter sp. TaxID=1882438 RepID=UPI0025EA3E7F|nr:hypothetical protein [Mucilaginibacter sp.]
MLKLIGKEVKSFTHQLNIDVLMIDLTARQIQINFNGADDWSEDCGTGAIATGDTLLRFMARGFDKDETTLGWRASLFNVVDNRKVCLFGPVVKTELR